MGHRCSNTSLKFESFLRQPGVLVLRYKDNLSSALH